MVIKPGEMFGVVISKSFEVWQVVERSEGILMEKTCLSLIIVLRSCYMRFNYGVSGWLMEYISGFSEGVVSAGVCLGLSTLVSLIVIISLIVYSHTLIEAHFRMKKFFPVRCSLGVVDNNVIFLKCLSRCNFSFVS